MDAELALQLLPVFAAYLVAAGSPGPSTMAIMGTAMRQGRPAALAMALGVTAGSQIWAIAAASGLSTLLSAFAGALTAIKIAGGLYLLHLAVKSARSALAPSAQQQAETTPAPLGAQFRRGLFLHLTNPKGVLGWIAILSLGLREGSPGHVLPVLIVGCGLICLALLCLYAVLFSTPPMVRAYLRARRWIEGAMAGLFAGAGLGLILSRA